MLSQERINDLIESKNELQHAIDCIDTILLSGHTITDASKDMDMTLQTFHRHIKEHFSHYVKHQLSFTKDDFEHFYASVETQSDKILRAVFNINTACVSFPEYDVNAFYDTYLRLLPDRDRNILLFTFDTPSGVYSRSLKETGEAFNLSRERIRQILRHSYRKLRQKESLLLLFPDQKETLDELLTECKKLDETSTDSIKAIEHYGKMMKMNKEIADKVDTFMAELQEIINDNSSIKESLPISEIGLSVRTYNALTHDGIEYIRDLRKYKTYDQIRKIRNIGVKSTKETIEVMQRYGLPAPDLP